MVKKWQTVTNPDNGLIAMSLELVFLLIIPIALSLPVYLLGRISGKFAKWSTVAVVTVTTVYSIILWIQKFFDPLIRATDSIDGFLYHHSVTWIDSIGVTFSVGVDGLSMPLLVLTQFIFLVSVISSFYVGDQEASYYALLLVLLSGVTGTFIALDIFLFYIAWELVLVPMFFLIHIWGGPERKYAAIKFFIYTHLASLVMLIGLFLIYINGQYTDATIDALGLTGKTAGDYTFYLPHLKVNLASRVSLGLVSVSTLTTIFWLVFIGFVTKFPQVPVHTWLPDAHVQAPSPGSAILAGLLLKMGGYGLFRIPFWLYSDISITENGQEMGFFLTESGETIRIIIAIIGMVSMVYPAFIALRQDDLKRMIAYSSISHMGIVLLGLAAYNEWGLNGAIYMMIAHGVISPGLFLLSGIIEHNTKSHTRLMSKVGGLGHKMPLTTGMFVFLGFASAGLPGLAGFVAEFSTFVGLFSDKALLGSPRLIWIPIIAVISIIITAGYYLWAIQRVLFNEPTEELEDTTPGKFYENFPIALLSIATLILGLLPSIVWWVINEFSVGILA